MHLSAPIYVLKRNAKLLARETGLALHQALDRIARAEGYQSWSHLAASASQESPTQQILARLTPGDLCLLGARPGQGKTLLGLDLASKAARLGRTGYFFTLDYHARDVADRLTAIGVDPDAARTGLVIDTSDDISAFYIIDRLRARPGPALIVVDYLQLLDQKRSTPGLDAQMTALRDTLTRTGAMCIAISQIDRAFDLTGKAMPDISDVRLPNPLDLSVFSKFFFLHNGRLRLEAAA